MLKDYYPYEANVGLTSFKFTSMVKGRKINKVVNFTKLVSIGEHIYNLAFGDYDENDCKLEVFVVSNNGYRDKVLNTVALTVLDFFEAHPDSVFIARRSTPSRTRLYRWELIKISTSLKRGLMCLGLTNINGKNFNQLLTINPFMSQKEIVVYTIKNMANNNLPQGKHIIQAKISNNVPDLSKHPFFVEKKETVIAFLTQHPLHDHLFSKK